MTDIIYENGPSNFLRERPTNDRINNNANGTSNTTNPTNDQVNNNSIGNNNASTQGNNNSNGASSIHTNNNGNDNSVSLSHFHNNSHPHHPSSKDSSVTDDVPDSSHINGNIDLNNEVYANQSAVTATASATGASSHVSDVNANGLHQVPSSMSQPQPLHWSEVVYECTDVPLEEWTIAGGSDYGQMPYLMDTGDILLELDGQQVAGLTRNDIIEMLRSSPTHIIKAVSSTASFGLPIDLREYLSRRFVRGSVDHELQALIRDNVYMRTIPCTTRPPRPGEVDNVDYKFVSRDDFLAMERSGVLLESGIFSGHYYGTPLPLSNPPTPTVPNMSQQQSRQHLLFDANHPHQLAVASGLDDSSVGGIVTNGHATSHATQPPTPATSLAAKRKRNRSNIAAIDASSLPHGWEKITDAQYGVYYIDHVNKRTQYERPYEIELVKGTNGFGFTLLELNRGLVVVKNIIIGGPAYHSGVIQPGDVLVSVSGASINGLAHSEIGRLFNSFAVGDRVKLTFARGYKLPPELTLSCSSDDTSIEYEYQTVTLEKGDNGFGFTISDGTAGQKVKKILDPDRCGSLRQGDILVSVNGINLSSFPHSKVVEILKECRIGMTVDITVKRKKRFRSKTPVIFQPHSGSFPVITDGSYLQGSFNPNDPSSMMRPAYDASYMDAGTKLPVRNCKTPSEEILMMARTASTPVPHFNDWTNSYAPVDGISGLMTGGANVASAATGGGFTQQPAQYPRPASVNYYPAFMSTPALPQASAQQQAHQRQTSFIAEAPMNHPPVPPPAPPKPLLPNMRYDENLNPKDPQIAAYGTTGTKRDLHPSKSAPLLPNPVSPNNGNLNQASNGSTNENSAPSDFKRNLEHFQALSQRHMQQQQPILSSSSQTNQNLDANGFNEGSIDETGGEDDEYEFHSVQLSRSEAGFGFRIVGGSEEGRNVAVGSIVLGGVAHSDGTLKSGDAIISINDVNVIGASHMRVVELMSSCGSTVSLLVRRRKHGEAFEVILERDETEGFGFVMISCGLMCLIGKIIDGSPAARCQRLRIRDRIIAVNDTDITCMSHPDIVNMIKESGHSLKLKIIPSDCYTVELVRGPRGFGFSIRGGAEFNGMPLFILKIAPDGPAYMLLSVGDEIIEINNVSTVGMTHTEAVNIISKSGPHVKLTLRRNTAPPPSPITPTPSQLTASSPLMRSSMTMPSLTAPFNHSSYPQPGQFIPSDLGPSATYPSSMSQHPFSAPDLNSQLTDASNLHFHPQHRQSHGHMSYQPMY